MSQGVTVTKVVFEGSVMKIDGKKTSVEDLMGLDVYVVKESCESGKKSNAANPAKAAQAAPGAQAKPVAAAPGAQAALSGGKKKKTKAPKKK